MEERTAPEEEKEAVKPKMINAPEKPTKKEIDEHMLTHLTYKSWCPHCVRRRGRADAHKLSRRKDGIPITQMDYWFAGKTYQGDKEKAHPVINLVDKELNAIFPTMVPYKGITDGYVPVSYTHLTLPTKRIV